MTSAMESYAAEQPPEEPAQDPGQEPARPNALLHLLERQTIDVPSPRFAEPAADPGAAPLVSAPTPVEWSTAPPQQPSSNPMVQLLLLNMRYGDFRTWVYRYEHLDGMADFLFERAAEARRAEEQRKAAEEAEPAEPAGC